MRGGRTYKKNPDEVHRGLHDLQECDEDDAQPLLREPRVGKNTAVMARRDEDHPESHRREQDPEEDRNELLIAVVEKREISEDNEKEERKGERTIEIQSSTLQMSIPGGRSWEGVGEGEEEGERAGEEGAVEAILEGGTAGRVMQVVCRVLRDRSAGERRRTGRERVTGEGGRKATGESEERRRPHNSHLSPRRSRKREQQ